MSLAKRSIPESVLGIIAYMKLIYYLKLSHILVVLILIPNLIACTPSDRYTPTLENTPTDTPVPATPTATSEPVAARINGEVISLSFFEGEVARYKLVMQENPEGLTDEVQVRELVINDLIDQVLLKQGAEAAGMQVSDEQYQQEITRLVSELGSEDALINWKTEYGYDDQQFEIAMRLSIAASWQKDQIAATIPEAVEQVHVQQIFAYTSEGAQRALTSLNSGTDFDEIAWTYDPVTGGDLGWFPFGYLTVDEVDVVAFSLGVGEYSQVIESRLGYHIIKVLEKDSAYPLMADARVFLQRQAVNDWLRISREQAKIEITY